MDSQELDEAVKMFADFDGANPGFLKNEKMVMKKKSTNMKSVVPRYSNKKVGKDGFSNRVERWKHSEEGIYMKNHCLRKYYETLREIGG